VAPRPLDLMVRWRSLRPLRTKRWKARPTDHRRKYWSSWSGLVRLGHGSRGPGIASFAERCKHCRALQGIALQGGWVETLQRSHRWRPGCNTPSGLHLGGGPSGRNGISAEDRGRFVAYDVPLPQHLPVFEPLIWQCVAASQLGLSEAHFGVHGATQKRKRVAFEASYEFYLNA
jgi:hypothetical protein